MSSAPGASASRLDWGHDDSESNILHVDMDSFFASVEIAEDPSLAGKPLIVGGLGLRGVVTSCTYDVRALGVRAGMPMGRALALAPAAVVVGGNRSLYRDYSAQVMQLLAAVSEEFEPMSIDEAFLDVTGARRRLGSPLEIAGLIRQRIFADLGLPSSVGIGPTKTVAKIASSQAKPNGVLLIPASRAVQFLHSLPVGALPGVGPKAQEALHRWGIEEVSQIASTTHAELSRILGPNQAHELLLTAQGHDRRKVGPRSAEKSISTEKTFSKNLTTRMQVERFLLEASHECAARLRESALLAHTVHVKLRSASFQTITRSHTLVSPTDVGRQVAAAATGIFSKEVLPRGGVRLVGVGVSGLVSREGGVQELLDGDPRPLAAERAMDEVRQKYGKISIRPASLLGMKTGEGMPNERQVPPAPEKDSHSGIN